MMPQVLKVCMLIRHVSRLARNENQGMTIPAHHVRETKGIRRPTLGIDAWNYLDMFFQNLGVRSRSSHDHSLSLILLLRRLHAGLFTELRAYPRDSPPRRLLLLLLLF